MYLSHSEPHIAMNPLDHNNLVAGSKMYVNLPNYLFKVGMYASFDGGRVGKLIRAVSPRSPLPVAGG